MDPNPTPWRAIEATSGDVAPAAPATSDDRSPFGLSRSAIGVLGAAALVAVAAFVLAFGSGGQGAVEVVGGSEITGSRGAAPSGAALGSGSVPGGAATELVVEIVGAVDRPGVYRLPSGSRVGDLVDAAGGYGPRVDASRASQNLNLAARLADGDQVRVPSRDDASDAPSSGQAAGTPGDGGSPVIDLNRATADELDTLPGIGPATAAKIIAARDEAPFTAVEDLQTRKLVGAKTFEGLRDLVAVR